MVPDDRRTITAAEARENLGIPASTVRGWAKRGEILAVSIGDHGSRWYLLREVLELAARRELIRRARGCNTKRG